MSQDKTEDSVDSEDETEVVEEMVEDDSEEPAVSMADKLIECEQERYKLLQSLIETRETLLEIREENLALREELEDYKSAPFMVATVEGILEDREIIIGNGGGQTFIVKVPQAIDMDEIDLTSVVALDKNNFNVVKVLPPQKDPIVLGAEIIEKPTTTYDDIGGLDDIIEDIRDAVELPLSDPKLFKKIGIKPPKGILLVGSPGTGKTLLAKAVANKTNASYIRLVGSELVQKFIGEGGRMVRELFQLAREKKPCIVFIDEIDAIGAKRLGMDTTGDREVQRTLMQLLAEMDGFNPLDDISIIAATNRVDIIDDALLRPGRFDRILEVNPPSVEGLEKIFEIHTKDMPLAKSVNLKALAAKMEGKTGADVENICREAGMSAVRRRAASVTKKDFENAFGKIREKEDVTAPANMFS